MTPRKYKITLEQLRMAAARYRRTERHPCADLIERVGNAMETNDYDAQKSWSHVKAMDKCLEEFKKNKPNDKKSTMYHLNKYLEQDKNKKK